MLRSILSRKWNFLVVVDRKLASSLVPAGSVPPHLSHVSTQVCLRINLSSRTLDTSGMLIAIKDLNAEVDHLLASLNVEHKVWRSLEAILVYSKALLQEHLGNEPRFQIETFQLTFENGLEIEISTRDYMIRKDYSLKVHHSLETDLQNGRPMRHGHDMLLKVALRHEVFKGVLETIQNMSKIVQTEILDRYQNGFLNRYFKVPTGEVLTSAFFKILRDKGLRLQTVELQETPRNTFQTTVD